VEIRESRKIVSPKRRVFLSPNELTLHRPLLLLRLISPVFLITLTLFGQETSSSALIFPYCNAATGSNTVSTDCRRRLNKDLYLLIPEHPMNPQQFERWKSQLSQLSPQQLRALQGEIDRSLHQNESALLTEEERDAIAHLFS
ncbi:hypothetical protein P3491_37760, partial [Vibrio parahaemolyticus]|nr:hypothetical protein [Vibrio parahaemolyticus]